MGRRSGGCGGKKPLHPFPFLSPSSSFSSSSSKLSRSVRRLPSLPRPPLAPPAPVTGKNRKRAASTRLWMRLDRRGGCEILMCDKAFVARRSGVPARDLRVLGPLLSRSPSILAREKAMVINLEFVRAIVTADEVLLLEPLVQEVLPFVEKLRRQFPLKSLEVDVGAGHVDNQDASCVNGAAGAERELPFEFQVLDLALEAVCLSFNSTVSGLNRHAISVLDDLTKNVSNRNLERVRRMKSSLTCLLAGVQKVRDEVDHLLNNSESMAHLYLSRNQTKSQQDEALMASVASNSIFPSETSLARPNSSIKQSMGIATSVPLDSDVEYLEMLLEAYFMQLDGIHNKILLVRRYIVDTEDYVNIQLDNKRNGLIRLQLTLTIASFGITINTFIAAAFAMNIPHNGRHDLAAGGPFGSFVGVTSSFCMLVVIMLFGYAWRNRLLST